jgi:hypothetical protein
MRSINAKFTGEELRITGRRIHSCSGLTPVTYGAPSIAGTFGPDQRKQDTCMAAQSATGNARPRGNDSNVRNI